VTGWWRKLHNEDLHHFHSSPSIIIMKSRRIIWAGYVTRMGQKRNAYRLLVEMPEGKRPLGRSRRRGVNNVRMDLLGMEWGDVDWTVWLRIGTSGELL
jgi:hypothetical protein